MLPIAGMMMAQRVLLNLKDRVLNYYILIY